MPTTSSPSRSPIDPGRRPGTGRAGFTLIEVLVASALGVGVLAMVTYAYLGANKMQALAVGGSYLKQSSDHGMRDLYGKLKQGRKIFDRGPTAMSWLARTDLRDDAGAWNPAPDAPYPRVETAELVLPRILPKASFWNEDAGGTANPDYDPAAVGNALFFATAEPRAILVDPPSGDRPLTDVFGVPAYHFPVYRLHFFFLARRDLGLGAPVRPGAAFTYQLTSWKSRPYLDYQEVKAFLARVKRRTPPLAYDPDPWIDAKLAGLAADFAGAIDLAAPDASAAAKPAALYRLEATATPDHLDLVPETTERFRLAEFRSALPFNARNGFAECHVAFNTSAPADGSYPAVALPIREHDVPAYADDGTNKPYGFEVLVGGPADARQVLARLTLAARAASGARSLVSHAGQQVIQVYEQ